MNLGRFLIDSIILFARADLRNKSHLSLTRRPKKFLQLQHNGDLKMERAATAININFLN